MMFRTQFSAHDRVFTCPGNPEKVTYILAYDDDGKRDLVPNGKVNIYDSIQSWKESADIKCIIERFLAGDPSVLQKDIPFYADVTQAPTSMRDYFDKLNKANDMFSKLPADKRVLFNNNPAEFFNEFGSAQFYSKLGLNIVDSAQTDSKSDSSEVTSNEKCE